MSKLIRGTMILTAAGIFVRVLGFFYRIFLSHFLGAERLGMYQMVFPIYSICYTLYAAGVQTGVSQIVSNDRQINRRLIKAALSITLAIALVLSLLLYCFSDFIAVSFIGAKGCAPLLRILSFIFPFCGITSIINGIFYGLGEAKVPATCQIIEQLIRILFVGFVAFLMGGNNIYITCEIAVYGLIAGEVAANIFNVISLFHRKPYHKPTSTNNTSSGIRLRLLKLAVPLSGTHCIVAILGSIEAVLIPSMLVRFGTSSREAFSLYGVLTGMALPFIFFPGAITNSLSVLLLPSIANAHGQHKREKIVTLCQTSIKFTLLLGLLAASIFSLYGKNLGILIYKNETAGSYLTVLSALCPFLYCATTLNSIINGLGKTSITFRNTLIGLLLRILLLIVFVPRIGMLGYLIGYLLSQMLITLLDGSYLYRCYPFRLSIISWFFYPAIFLWGIGILIKKGALLLSMILHGQDTILLFGSILTLIGIFTLFLKLTGVFHPPKS